MHYTKHTITSFIHQADVIVKNTYDVNDIRTAVNKYGYGESEIDEGKRLVAELRNVAMQQHMAKSEKAKNYKRKRALQAQVHKDYMKYVKIARIAFADDVKARKALVLDGARGRVYNEWLFQVSSFCSIMLENEEGYVKRIAKYGVSKEDIKTLKDRLVKLNRISDMCLKSVGEVRKLTAERQQKVLEMQRYVSDLLKIARIALEYSPQLLECLGLGVKN